MHRAAWPEPALAISLLAALAAVSCADGAGSGIDGDWPTYRGDAAGTGHSPLSEITPDNVRQLGEAWSYDLTSADGAAARSRGARSQATPIVIDGVMYLPAADRIVALDPTTGQEIWQHPLEEGSPSRRGVAYWRGGGSEAPRILFTSGLRLIALDAETGAPAPGFGENGQVDLGIPYLSVPFVHDDIVVVGANTPPGTIGGVGNARAFDARTGEKLWEFESVARPGSVGGNSWEGDSWRGRLGANAWPFYFTFDEDLDLLYIPLASPIPGAYGGDRPGDNLFGNSVVAVNLRTGNYVWHFQTIHHDLWDADPPAPPTLFDIPGEGGPVKALGVTTKSGYLYILNRETGEPIFAIEETPVPQSEVPGEATSPTQPIPVLPAPLARTRYGPDDLVTAEETSAEHVAACEALVESTGEIYNEGPFSPWVFRPAGSPGWATLLFPGLVGGPNWGGVAADPESNHLFIFSQDLGSLGWVERADSGYPVPYDRSGPRPSSFDVDMGESRWPCQTPPWGQLIAIDGATGQEVWRRPLGVTEGLPGERRETGRPGRAGAIVTDGGLLFIGSTDDGYFRSLDAATGETLWETRLPAQGNANPMTYRGSNGKQYVAIAATDQLMVFALP